MRDVLPEYVLALLLWLCLALPTSKRVEIVEAKILKLTKKEKRGVKSLFEKHQH